LHCLLVPRVGWLYRAEINFTMSRLAGPILNNNNCTFGMNIDISCRVFVNGGAIAAGALAPPMSALATETEYSQGAENSTRRHVRQCGALIRGDLKPRVHCATANVPTYPVLSARRKRMASSPPAVDRAVSVRLITFLRANGWPHDYAYPYDTRGDSNPPDDERPHIVGRGNVWHIAMANADSRTAAYTNVAIDEAHRAVQETVTTFGMK
jgi:hypothetical protein